MDEKPAEDEIDDYYDEIFIQAPPVWVVLNLENKIILRNLYSFVINILLTFNRSTLSTYQ